MRVRRAFVGLAIALLGACGVEGPWTSDVQLASCIGGDVPFPATVLNSAPLQDGDHPALEAVRRELGPRGHLRLAAELAPFTEIRLLSERDGQATFAFGATTAGDFPYANFRREGGAWKLRNSGSNCRPTGWGRGRPGSSWEPIGAVGPGDRHVAVLVHEFGCASGRSAAGRVEEPTIVSKDDAVVVTITIRPPRGNQTCPGNPPTPFEFDLPAPLGDRRLLDGSFVPPQPPGTERPPV
jgi:hypothetical protein